MRDAEAQPAKGILAVQRISQREAAEAIGCTATYLCSVLNGAVTPSEQFRQRLAAYLDQPVEHLFRTRARCQCGREVLA